jgi:hypothetical protein
MIVSLLFLPLMGYLFCIHVWDSSTVFLWSEEELSEISLFYDFPILTHFTYCNISVLMYNKNINKRKSHFYLRTMSSTHSDSNSQKVYRQPQEPTLQQVLEALKQVSQKVEELLEKVHAYDVSYVAANLLLEPVRAEMEKARIELEKAKADLEKAKDDLEKAKIELKKVKADLEKVKATGLVKFIRELFPGQQNGTEDSQKSACIGKYEQIIQQKSACIEEYKQIIQQKSAQIKEYEQTIEKRTDSSLRLKEQILIVVDELDQVVNTVLSLSQIWATAVIKMAREDLFHATITPEDLIHIQGIAEIAEISTRQVKIVEKVTKYIKLSFTVGIYYRSNGSLICPITHAPPDKPIGVHHVRVSGTEWSYQYGIGNRMYLYATSSNILGFETYCDRYQTNDSIRENISTPIATLEKIAHLFPSPSPAKPDTQTA